MLDFESLSERARSRWIFLTAAFGVGLLLAPLLLPAVSDVVSSLAKRAVSVQPVALPVVAAPPPMPPPFPGTDSTVQREAQPLLLVAVTLGSSPKSGQVLIGTNRRYPQTYQVGSVLANGAVVEEIRFDRVVLRRGTQREELRLAAADRGGPLSRIPPMVAAHPSAADSRADESTLADAPAPNFEQAVTAQPVYDGTVLKGLQISAGLPPGEPAAFGLERGDVVTAIEGSPVADPVDAWQQLAAVAAVHGSVTVRRAGKVQGVRLVPAALAGPTGSAVPSVQVAP
jgi:hypothetical protein